jgi:hypothetical protein
LNLGRYAPVGILPLAVGASLGAILGGLGAWIRIAGPTRLVIGAVLLALVAVMTEHAWLYRDFRRQWHAARAASPHVAMFRPETPWSPHRYAAEEFSQGRAVLWMVDASLVMAAAVGATLWSWPRWQAYFHSRKNAGAAEQTESPPTGNHPTPTP